VCLQVALARGLGFEGGPFTWPPAPTTLVTGGFQPLCLGNDRDIVS